MTGRLDFSWLELDAPERRPLKRQPVVLALFAVKFYPVLRVDSRDVVARFQDAIRGQFPVFEQAAVSPMPIQLPGAGVTIDPSATMPISWLFQDVSRTWTVTLNRETLGFETRSYTGFEEFSARLTPILDALVTHIVPTLGTRIGLRYLNEIRPGAPGVSGKRAKGDARFVDWSKVIRPELLGIEREPVFHGRVNQSLHQLGLRDKHGVGININHGVIPRGSLIDTQSSGTDKLRDHPFYALDIDAFQEFERGREFAVNSEAILDRLNQFHDAISRIFRWSLNSDYLASLEGASRGSR